MTVSSIAPSFSIWKPAAGCAALISAPLILSWEFTLASVSINPSFCKASATASSSVEGFPGTPLVLSTAALAVLSGNWLVSDWNLVLRLWTAIMSSSDGIRPLQYARVTRLEFSMLADCRSADSDAHCKLATCQEEHITVGSGLTIHQILLVSEVMSRVHHESAW